MKYLKKFNQLNEAVIMPKEIKSDGNLRTIDDFKRLGEKEGFDVLDYDEFYNSLSDKDKKDAPPRNNPMAPPFFALFHPINLKPTLVFSDMMINMHRNPQMPIPPMLSNHILDVMRHEFIHKEQGKRAKIEYKLPNPNDRAKYFSDKNEIMAFSFSIATEIKKSSKSFEEAIDKFENEDLDYNTQMLWDSIINSVSNKIYKRYTKYIYMYLEKMFEEEKEN